MGPTVIQIFKRSIFRRAAWWQYRKFHPPFSPHTNTFQFAMLYKSHVTRRIYTHVSASTPRKKKTLYVYADVKTMSSWQLRRYEGSDWEEPSPEDSGLLRCLDEFQ
jgi:hypothetical protein